MDQKKASSPSSQLVGNCFFFGAMPKKKVSYAMGAESRPKAELGFLKPCSLQHG